MIDEWKSSDIMKQNPYQYIKSESEKFFASLIRNAGGDVDENGQVIPGSISADSFQEQQKIDQIFETVNNKFHKWIKRLWQNHHQWLKMYPQ